MSGGIISVSASSTLASVDMAHYPFGMRGGSGAGRQTSFSGGSKKLWLPHYGHCCHYWCVDGKAWWEGLTYSYQPISAKTVVPVVVHFVDEIWEMMREAEKRKRGILSWLDLPKNGNGTWWNLCHAGERTDPIYLINLHDTHEWLAQQLNCSRVKFCSCVWTWVLSPFFQQCLGPFPDLEDMLCTAVVKCPKSQEF